VELAGTHQGKTKMIRLSTWALTKLCVTVGKHVFGLSTLLANHCLAARNVEESREYCTFEIVRVVT
jgi:hypothetical protein